MMPNDINAICKSNDLVSGSARSQMLKDGSFAGPGLFAEDPETQQKNFLSLLSRLGNGTLQVVPEESKSVNLKPEQGRLTDEGNADNAFAGKPKEKLKKEGTEGNGVKRLSSVNPESLGLLMGFLSLPDPLQSDMSAPSVYHIPDSDNEEKAPSGLIDGALLPETTVKKGMPGKSGSQTGSSLLSPVLSDSNQQSAVPVQGAANDPGQRQEPSATPEPIPSAIGLFAKVKAAQIFPGQPEAPTDTQADFSGTNRVQAVLLEESSKSYKQQQRVPLSNPDTVDFKPVAEKINPNVKGGIAQRLSTNSMARVAAVPERAPTDQKGDPDVPRNVKMKSTMFYSVMDSIDTEGIPTVSAGTLNGDGNETPDLFMGANHPESIAKDPEGAHLLPQDPESKALAVNFARENQVQMTSGVNPSAKGSRLEVPSFQTEVLNQIVEETSTTLKSGQSEFRIDIKPETLGHLRLCVSSDHQRVTVKILAENPQVKEMIENQAALIKSELQHQGIQVNTVKVDMLMSGGSEFAYSQHEGAASRQARHEPAYVSGRDNLGESGLNEPESLDQASNRGGSLVNYFA